MAASTVFRQAVAAHVSTVTGITLVVNGEREGVSDDGDLIAVWTATSQTNEENAHFRLYTVMARVFVAWDAQVGADEDDPLDRLEDLEESLLAATPAILGGARVVSVDALFFGTAAAIDLVYVGELPNAASEV